MDAPGERGPYRLVVAGASAGGLHALRTVVAGLPPEFSLPVVVVQHRSKDSHLLCELLQDCTPFRVSEVVDKEEIAPRTVYIAPPDYHLQVEPGYFSLSVDEPVRYSRPSVDVMFESAVDVYGSELIGVVLTGANADGARGLRRIVDAGGGALVQDPATADVKLMPLSALRAVPEAEVVPLERIAERLAEMAARPLAPPRKRA